MKRWFIITAIAALLALAVCGGALFTAMTPPPGSLTQPTWTLRDMEVDGQAQSLSTTRHANLRFDGAHRQMSGFGGCNSFTGSYSVMGGALRVDVREMTAMACWGGDAASTMKQEQIYLQALALVTTYHITGRILTLSDGGGVTLTFVAA